MRTLTVRRRKTFFACFIKFKVYIEDHESKELTINGTPCRFLGTLKNGEEKFFEISESRAKVFVIWDKFSKDLCNDFYEIEESDADVYLSGINHFNLPMGNQFFFDNNMNEEAIQQRKKNNKKVFVIYISLFIVGGIAGLLLAIIPIPKTFSDNGLTITLTDNFKYVQVDGYDATYSSNNVAVFAVKGLSFVDYPLLTNYTIDEYMSILVFDNGQSVGEINKSVGVPYFEYEYEDSSTGTLYICRCFAYKTEDAFWLVAFAVTDDKYDEYSSKINEWANSVEFD